LKHRSEIDGLRAIAVLPVILFHAGLEVFGGGFVGVDVFFVISGYLITTIIIQDIENKNFSLIDFYERRARRIIPALIFVSLACIPFSWTWMSPSQMQDFSQSLIGVGLFSSNILFWIESDYFDTASALKPLLHTWSLAVEEQFYLAFPIFLLAIWGYGKNKVIWILFSLSLISLVLSELGWRHTASANFYLLPTRAWEILAGSIAALTLQKYHVKANSTLSLLGLITIIFSIFTFNWTTPTPSLHSLIPVVGTVFVIIFAGEGTLTEKILSTSQLVKIGLISYSAYLWHQPLFAFARILSTNSPSLTLMISLVFITLILAWFSWKFIETPFRKKVYFERKEIFIFAIAGTAVIVLFGVLGHMTNGYQHRFKTDSTIQFDPSDILTEQFKKRFETEIEGLK